MQKYVTNSVIVIVGLYIVFAGLAAVSAVLEFATWEEVKEWLTKGAAVAAVVLVINVVITFLTQFIPHSNDSSKKK
jgi:uncharacterized membrane protein